MKKSKIKSLMDVLGSSVHSQRTVLRSLETLSGKHGQKRSGLTKWISFGITLGGALRTIIRLLRSIK